MSFELRLKDFLAREAHDLWITTDRPDQPFGFQFFNWHLEVHPVLVQREPPRCKLEVFKVTETGRLEEVCHVRV